MTDITSGGLERAYQALRESEELHRVTLSHISDAVFLTDDDGQFTYICPNVHIIFGYGRDEVENLARIAALLGENLFDPRDLDELGEIRNIERDVRTKSGEERHLLIHVKAVCIKDGTVLYSCRDITERNRVQEELRITRLELAHASRLALAGELTASIAHEIGQPLTAIAANASAGQLLLAGGGGNGKAADLENVFADIVDDVHRAIDVMNRLRALVRKQPLRLQSLDLSQLVADTLLLLKGEFRQRRITIETKLASSLLTVEADRVSLQQVLLNLLVNAMDAIDTINGRQRRLLVEIRPLHAAVEITVTDSGAGVPDGCLDKIFEPFFTTKRQGIGLGLVVSRSIVEAHSGRIWAENDIRGGARFHVTLPVPSSA